MNGALSCAVSACVVFEFHYILAMQTNFIVVAMERAGTPLLLSGHPAEGSSPAPMDQPQWKRPRLPSEAE
eukprot:scaffold304934_cov27-Tisochrysis_lutea.AAC.3